ncbi:hypothetical protein LFML04_0019 [Leptospirillum ferriphilum ML-04]|uniref:Uncharacterized protein n=1 Tax=Leptospirillum ferriphilum (strain ML-04) TaxID=1048260 RepID=J9Z8L8_LEPFM|nr:hypothetical protein LFML04_0019 [Leptospirillum ferriphilum ML-04]
MTIRPRMLEHPGFRNLVQTGSTSFFSPSPLSDRKSGNRSGLG